MSARLVQTDIDRQLVRDVYDDEAVRAGREALWPGTGASELALNAYRIFASVDDATGLCSVGFATRVLPPQEREIRLQRAPDGIHVDEELHAYIGPRSGLTPTQNQRAHIEALRLWFQTMLGEHAGPWQIAGLVPANWPQSFFTMYRNLVGAQETPVYAGELWPMRDAVLVHGEIHQLAQTLAKVVAP